MAAQQPIFDTIIYGTGTLGTSTWVDLGAIPTGKQISIGFATLVAEDKNLQFVLRSNLTGQGAGTDNATALHDWAAAPSGLSVDRDLYQNGNIQTVTVVGTGTEHWWLHVQAQSNATGTYDYIIRYLLQ